jgi:hypothetical protein
LVHKIIVQEIFISDHKAEIVEIENHNLDIKQKIKFWSQSYTDKNVSKYVKLLRDKNWHNLL